MPKFITFAVSHMLGRDGDPSTAIPVPVQTPSVKQYVRPSYASTLALRQMLYRHGYPTTIVPVEQCITRNGRWRQYQTPNGIRITFPQCDE